MKIVIASRKSDLARIQAQEVGARLVERFPDIEIKYLYRESLGDKNLIDPLWKAPVKGVFTEDFVADLADGRCDVVVHSWKDLPTEPRPTSVIAATLARADARDVLLVKPGGWEGPRFVVLSSSPRRAYNLEPFLTWALPRQGLGIEFRSVRGNVQTRVRKLLEDREASALVVAKAALDRLLSAEAAEFDETRAFLRKALDGLRFMVLPFSANPAAAAQGALAIETRNDAGSAELRRRLETINDVETYAAVAEEREILRGYGGGCHQKIGIHVCAHAAGRVISLRGLTDQGEKLDRFELREGREAERFAESACFPRSGEERSFWSRRDLGVARPEDAAAFWVAKADALPKSWELRSNDIVWTGGLETWRQLAARGIFVNGSSDMLGESSATGLMRLTGRAVPWLKLTHADSAEALARAGVVSSMPILPTYSLVPAGAVSLPDLSTRSNFYWSSFSTFLRACERFPGIEARGQHASGPGHTREALARSLRGEAKLFTFLGLSEWRNSTIR